MSFIKTLKIVVLAIILYHQFEIILGKNQSSIKFLSILKKGLIVPEPEIFKTISKLVLTTVCSFLLVLYTLHQ